MTTTMMMMTMMLIMISCFRPVLYYHYNYYGH